MLFKSRQLRILSSRALPIDRPYVRDTDHWKRCLLALTLHRHGVSSPRNLVDAYAIDYLRWFNEALPNGHVAILYTRTRPIFATIDEFRRSHPEYLTKHGIPLIQLPQSALVHFGFFGALKHPDSALLRNQLAVARAKSAAETRKRLSDLRDRHERGHPVTADYVSDLEDRFTAASRAFDRLVKVALNTMLVNPEHRRNRLYEFLTRHDVDLDPLALLNSFEKLLDECVNAGEAARSRLYLSVFPKISWDDVRVKSRAQSMLLGPLRALGSPPTDYIFRSATIRQLFDQFESMQKSGATDLPRIMRSELIEQELTLKNEPEFYLLLSFVFSMCQDMWLQAHDAAEQGLRMVFPPEGAPSNESRADSIGDWEVITACELWLAEGTALGRWGLEQRAHRELCAQYMSTAAERLEQCLAWREKWRESIENKNTGMPVRDYRCLRELSFLYGAASDWGLPLGPADREETTDEVVLLRKIRERAIQYAREGFEAAPADSACYFYLANNMLYGLTRLASDPERHLEERAKYCAILEAEGDAAAKPAILDTLQQYYAELATHETDSGLQQEHLQKASSYMKQAVDMKRLADEPTRAIIDRHKREA